MMRPQFMATFLLLLLSTHAIQANSHDEEEALKKAAVEMGFQKEDLLQFPNSINEDGSSAEGNRCAPISCGSDNEVPVPKLFHDKNDNDKDSTTTTAEMKSGYFSHGCNFPAVADTNIDISTLIQTPTMQQCCHTKIACFQTSGTLKHVCDEQFLACATQACNASMDNCDAALAVLAVFVKSDDCGGFYAAQSHFCECVPEAEAKTKRKRILQHIFEQHDPKGLRQLDQLAAQASTPARMAALLMKLIKKFPALVEKRNEENGRIEKEKTNTQDNKPKNAATQAEL